MKKICFITFSTLESSSSDIARLKTELEELLKYRKIDILYLGCQKERYEIKHKNLKFHKIPIHYLGWNVKNLSKIVSNIRQKLQGIDPNIVILTKEVWDLIRELKLTLGREYPLGVALNAMPFLGAPQKVSKSFETDVKKYLNSEIEAYKKEYNEKHYKELFQVFNDLNLIAATKTVSYYIRNYFSKKKHYTYTAYVPFKKTIKRCYLREKYDFLYMARIEKGKGIEYFSKILPKIADNLKRPISLAIAGRPDDPFSEKELKKLLNSSQKTDKYDVYYLNWINEKEKNKVLNSSSVFLYPSYFDTYSLTLSEALAYGMPAVAWDVLFIKHNYKNIKSVKKVPFDDINEFSKQAVKCIKNQEKLSICSKKFFDTCLSTKDLVKNDLMIYDSIEKDFNEKNYR